ncbi:endonuclease/exonuclease/phosphatase family protein [Epibacterium sp. SM1979]|uniref:Endonuclease/exonuclease/phosphatase family protein n=1 Tax=Tritonibacter litoralis TaxID=2662264 RepID=A0A843YGW8_9RHOB|nr:endonuclease/exonuclease/phosphatase family protein [Tritonibacter litoralis]MQQ10406.1 endonuclease/exonuclease/phosphatase family protein [Tritonibacter litoralis]
MKGWISALILFLLPISLRAEPLRIATFSTELSQKGPGLLLREITNARSSHVASALAVIAANDPDILVLQGIDWDFNERTARALQMRLSDQGLSYPFWFTARPNSGLATGLDMDGDRRTGGPRDAQGYGDFTGAHGMLVLSRYPLITEALRDFTDILWADLPWADLPTYPDGTPFPSQVAQTQQRLSSTNHWILPVIGPNDRRLDLMIFSATPPVFDGAEDRNGKRNHDEIALWQHVLDGQFGPQPKAPVVVIGNANLDPAKGDGRHVAIQALRSHPRLQDPAPSSPQAGTATVDWEQTGPMRVDYILPDAQLTVTRSGVHWPQSQDDPAAYASRHRLVWVDLDLP